MTTDRQIAANRANALKSTGPRTKAGKAASSRNNTRHGLAPANPFEEALADRIALILWRLGRVAQQVPNFDMRVFTVPGILDVDDPIEDVPGWTVARIKQRVDAIAEQSHRDADELVGAGPERCRSSDRYLRSAGACESKDVLAAQRPGGEDVNSGDSNPFSRSEDPAGATEFTPWQPRYRA